MEHSDNHFNILCDPWTRERLIYSEHDNCLSSEKSNRSYKIINGVPVLWPEFSPKIHDSDHISNLLAPEAEELIQNASGLVLNLSAGGTKAKNRKVIEVEAGIFRNTDYVADAHNLPFVDGCFSLVVCINAFEHYANPFKVADEIFRVLAPGGKVFIHTANLQPLHEPPFHFFNCTKYGLREWMRKFEELDLGVTENFTAGYTLSWLLSETDWLLRSEGFEEAANRLQTARVSHIIEFWRNPKSRVNSHLWNDLASMPQHIQDVVSAGFQYIGQKK
jgi:SAM-dependent methyltransferase